MDNDFEWVDAECALQECPHCQSTEFMSDYFEEEWIYWCGQCGRNLTEFNETEEMRLYNEENDGAEQESTDESEGDEAQGKPISSKIPGLGGLEV